MKMWEVLWVTYALSLREYLTLYRTILCSVFISLKNFKSFLLPSFEYGRKQLAISKCAKYLYNYFFGSLLARCILFFKQLNYCRESHFRAGRGGTS